MPNVFLESHHIKNLNFGFGQFNYHLIKGLHHINPSDFDITLHAKDLQKLKHEFGNDFKYKKYYSLRRYDALRIRKKYDLWHSMNQNTKIEPYHDIPYLLTIHNTSYIKDKTDYKDKKEHVLFQDKINRSTAITYISEYAKSSTHQFFDVPKVPEYVIHNGNPILEMTITDDYKAAYIPNRPFLFTIGEVKERKNFKSLIGLIKNLDDYHLIIAGKNSTSEAENIQALIDENQLNDRIKLVGKISESDKQFYYKNCAAFVFPSLREGFGLPVIEAMKFGKPTFISNNTSLPEIGGDLSFYWDHYDPEYMAEVFQKGMSTFENSKTQYIKQLKERANSFNWNDAAKAYIEVYRSLLK
ncbi:glycosyltransferase family 4 protein [Psychroserpens algicola]|uniref:glycosyltransferase family 4 protein n=1 Tax=Psychroserpens algicola TaxID=1719034 RepID=UPI001953E18B|nr:glycosyltransferase family 1 protein [Psychroserpens algicola]